jgi:eukaryotic-like serine/threonine-protein kinase
MDTTLSDPMVDRLLDARYAVHHRLARGGMASVYLATDTRLDRRVAVKVMHPGLADDPEFVARFNREARAAAGLNHPDIVAVYDQGTDDGHPFLVMEYVPGATLRLVLRERGRLSPAEALAVMDHVLAALAAAHASGLVHRDVKPENVLVTPDGRVKVADFGLARAASGIAVTSTTGPLIGTAAYLAPEQVRDGSSDARSDVYAAGVVLFELLTGAPPFTGDSAVSVAYRHVNEDVPEPSTRAGGIPSELDALVLAATARDPFDRPADARALHASLMSVRDRLGLHAAVPTAGEAPTPTDTLVVDQARAATTTVVAPSQSAPPRPPSDDDAGDDERRRRWPWVVALLTAAVVVAAFMGWYLAVGRYTAAPNVVGLTKTAAAAKLDKAGLKVRWLPSVYNDTIDVGLVAEEHPNAGHDLRKGGTVSVALSRGKDHVPDVRGKSVDEATSLLAQADLTVAGTQSRYDDTVRKGLVITSTPKPGVVVSPHSAVTLIVSEGPSPVTMPDVTGKPADQATSILTALGLKVKPTKDFSDKVPENSVISTDPTAGANAHKGDTVTLVVSKGPQTFPVPNVTGMNVNDAIATLQAAGFQANVNQFPGGPGRVLRQSPGANSKQKHGTTVQLYVF